MSECGICNQPEFTEREVLILTQALRDHSWSMYGNQINDELVAILAKIEGGN